MPVTRPSVRASLLGLHHAPGGDIPKRDLAVPNTDHAGPPPWMRPAQLTDECLHLCRHLMQTRRQTAGLIRQPTRPRGVAAQPRMNRLPSDPAVTVGHILTVAPSSKTSCTAA
jgi:hypothetical protein